MELINNFYNYKGIYNKNAQGGVKGNSLGS